MGMRKNVPNKPLYFKPDARHQRLFTRCLHQCISSNIKEDETLLILCVGTDKITGDCLGPLVGSRLAALAPSIPVYGSLQHPVHALNLSDTVYNLQYRYPHPFFLVIDAALGPTRRIGYVTLSEMPLYPGEGIHRPLPPVGNVSVTGIVSDICTTETDLSFVNFHLVERIAVFIASSIMECV